MRNLNRLAIVLAYMSGVVASDQALAAPGITITAGIYFQTTFSPNYFDPANGYVPETFQNHAGATRLVPYDTSGEVLSFGYYDKANQDGLEVFVDAAFKQGTIYLSDRTYSTAYAFYAVLEASAAIFANVSTYDDAFGGSFVVSGQGKTLVYYAPAFDHAGDRFAILNFDTSPFRSPQPLALESLSSVPEPATWATMTLGFGIIGAAMRRGLRRRRISLDQGLCDRRITTRVGA